MDSATSSAGEELGTVKATRALRADAQRSEEAVLEAATRVFVEYGVDAPIRTIASTAGVGLGTLYRRFPKRSDLIASVFRREIDACGDAAESFARDHGPMEALVLWLRRYVEFMSTKKGLSAALHSGDPAYDALPDYFRSRFEPALTTLLHAAAAAGDVRRDIAAYDILRAVGNLSAATGADAGAHLQTMLNLLIDGLRVQASAPPP
ncbi:TetR/AcrR family transcriptional regulator [Sphingomonas sp. CGMCC 1.13654]|uniref:TetR/AcrR family transcriptional regulator n=1 Tax=Sphingomonas chungangi TaxID=2683589 RepID=A0A838L3B8_9SPHN|nr:TetR/AcrR family transcriptional regulator [Sphingomonas chungangi]MBA2933557.1 TetR/AcrR family transcriptional regulator [Sphingomonas chungangi]MVW54890.1 TetR family transcriptional regulator [Sphingomonas chungangi]